MDKRKEELYMPESIASLTDAEFLQFLYSERAREESLNSYQGWNVWAVVGALITVACAAYGVMSSHAGGINKVRTLYLVSFSLSCIFMLWYAILFYMSYLNRKRAKDYKRIKHLKEVAPIPYLIIVTICSLELAIYFIIVVNNNGWNAVAITWILLALCHLLICINVYVNRNAIVWSLKDDFWFVKTWQMLTAGLSLFVMFWLVWKWSMQNISGPYVCTPEFELAVCITGFIMLIYLFLKIKLAYRKSSEIDVLIDEYVYKGISKESVYRLLRANQMGYSILEACSQELYVLERYSEKFKLQKEKLETVKDTIDHGDVDIDCLMERLDILKQAMDANDEWASRVNALYDKVNEIDKNVPELRDEEEFVNMLKIVGHMMDKGKEMNDQIRAVIEKTENFMEGYKKKIDEL